NVDENGAIFLVGPLVAGFRISQSSASALDGRPAEIEAEFCGRARPLLRLPGDPMAQHFPKTCRTCQLSLERLGSPPDVRRQVFTMEGEARRHRQRVDVR